MADLDDGAGKGAATTDAGRNVKAVCRPRFLVLIN